jgi:hypothetical protein
MSMITDSKFQGCLDSSGQPECSRTCVEGITIGNFREFFLSKRSRENFVHSIRGGKRMGLVGFEGC